MLPLNVREQKKEYVFSYSMFLSGVVMIKFF